MPSTKTSLFPLICLASIVLLIFRHENHILTFIHVNNTRSKSKSGFRDDNGLIRRLIYDIEKIATLSIYIILSQQGNDAMI